MPLVNGLNIPTLILNKLHFLHFNVDQKCMKNTLGFEFSDNQGKADKIINGGFHVKDYSG